MKNLNKLINQEVLAITDEGRAFDGKLIQINDDRVLILTDAEDRIWVDKETISEFED
jgi:small nuclear ribonucleoprotein (snRNP)-like protein